MKVKTNMVRTQGLSAEASFYNEFNDVITRCHCEKRRALLGGTAIQLLQQRNGLPRFARNDGI
jgi:hypothetical protein